MSETLVKQAREGRTTVSIMKACALCGVSRRTIYNWMGRGKVEFVRTAGGSIRIFTDTLFTPGGPIEQTGETTTVEASAR